MIDGTVDRTWENDPDPDSSVTVTLDNGFKVDFWMKGLTDKEYISRANIIYRLENKGEATNG